MSHGLPLFLFFAPQWRNNPASTVVSIKGRRRANPMDGKKTGAKRQFRGMAGTFWSNPGLFTMHK